MSYELKLSGETERCSEIDIEDAERSVNGSGELHWEKANGLGEEGGEDRSGKETELHRGVAVPEIEGWGDWKGFGHKDRLGD